MSALYDEAAVEAAAATWWAGNGYAWSDEIDDDDKPFLLSEFRAVLDAAAPLIVAKALRDAARWIDDVSEGGDGLYAGDCTGMLHERADAVIRRGRP